MKSAPVALLLTLILQGCIADRRVVADCADDCASETACMVCIDDSAPPDATPLPEVNDATPADASLELDRAVAPDSRIARDATADLSVDAISDPPDQSRDAAVDCIPRREVADDLLDNDCDGEVDELAPHHVRDISIGDRHACAVLSDGRVKCWGATADLRLGAAFPDDDILGDRPEELGDALPAVPLWNQRAVQVLARARTCVVFDDGALACWGAVREEQPPVPPELIDTGGAPSTRPLPFRIGYVRDVRGPGDAVLAAGSAGAARRGAAPDFARWHAPMRWPSHRLLCSGRRFGLLWRG